MVKMCINRKGEQGAAGRQRPWNFFFLATGPVISGNRFPPVKRFCLNWPIRHQWSCCCHQTLASPEECILSLEPYVLRGCIYLSSAATAVLTEFRKIGSPWPIHIHPSYPELYGVKNVLLLLVRHLTEMGMGVP